MSSFTLLTRLFSCHCLHGCFLHTAVFSIHIAVLGGRISAKSRYVRAVFRPVRWDGPSRHTPLQTVKTRQTDGNVRNAGFLRLTPEQAPKTAPRVSQLMAAATSADSDVIGGGVRCWVQPW